MGFTPKTIGILGGGHLSRMTALAAARLGIRVCILTNDENSPAAQIVPFTFVGDNSNHALLKEFASCVDVITYEDDSIPLETLRYLQKFKPVYPDDRVLGITQNRVRQKHFLNEVGVPTTRWAAINRANDIAKAMEDLQIERAVLKNALPGVTADKQMDFVVSQDAKTAWRDMNATQLILEEKVTYSCEISTIIARDPLGQTASYGPILNERNDHNVLIKSTIPASIPAQLSKKAATLTQFIAEALDVIGVLCVEFFVTSDGRLLVNKISPHPHDSGHWTMEACLCSQFEQQVRTICGMQVGAPGRHSDAIMIPLAGDEAAQLNKYIEMPNAAVHLYGKIAQHSAQKIGHVTLVGPVPVDTALGISSNQTDAPSP
jgi:5-(carboxyamino)imidazole ribonucleotide synthase